MSDMIELKRGGIHRIVATEEEAKKLIADGFVQLDVEGNPITPESKTIEELKADIAALEDTVKSLKADNKALKAENAELKKTQGA